jgi:hypothetical protein
MLCCLLLEVIVSGGRVGRAITIIIFTVTTVCRGAVGAVVVMNINGGEIYSLM